MSRCDKCRVTCGGRSKDFAMRVVNHILLFRESGTKVFFCVKITKVSCLRAPCTSMRRTARAVRQYSEGVHLYRLTSGKKLGASAQYSDDVRL